MITRVTRSRKIDISEDHTAVEGIPSLHCPALTEVNNNMATEDKGIAAELKGLKAAYKQAINYGKKSRKVKGKERGSQEETINIDVSDLDSNSASKENTHFDPPPPYDDPIRVSASCDTSDSTLQAPSKEALGSYAAHCVTPSQPNMRMTRRQAAQKQEGMYAGMSSFPDRPSCFLGSRLPVSSFSGATDVPFSGLQARFPVSYFRSESSIEGKHYVAASSSAALDAQPSVEELPLANFNPSYLAEKALDDFLKKNVEGTKILDNVSQTKDQDHDQQLTQKPRSPVKSVAVTLDEIERIESTNRATPVYDSDDDSFIEVITSRSPAKSVSRIEDSVEALDRFEEAIDTLQEVALARSMLSPHTKDQPNCSPHSQNDEHAVLPHGAKSLRVKPTAPRASTLKRASSMTFRRPSEAERSVENTKDPGPRKGPPRRPLSLQAPKPPIKSSKPVTISTFELPGEAVARRLKEQREARLAQRELAENNAKATPKVTITRVRSNKPPTRPSFELPGEAISRRKREAHEAKLKAQEEEGRKKREFKAKPLRTSLQPVTLPRNTAASLARRSKIGIEGPDCLSISKSGANVGAHRLSIAQIAQANTSAPRSPCSTITRQPTITHTSTTRKVSGGSNSSLSGLPSQRAVTATDVQAQRQRAKEIYNRDQRGTEDFEREKREREAAARLAREAAAERGRQASREWAEKQKLKKTASMGRAGMGERVKEMLVDRPQGPSIAIRD